VLEEWLQSKYRISCITEYRSELAFQGLDENMIKIEILNMYSEFVDYLETAEF